MDLLVTYDVSTEDKAGRRRLRKVAKVCVDYGQRVQQSVFECRADGAQYEQLEDRLTTLIEEDEDSLRIYRLAQPTDETVRTWGRDDTLDLDEPLVL